MEPIETLRTQFNTLMDVFLHIFNTEREKAARAALFEHFKKIVREIEKLEPKIREESLVLATQNRITNAALTRYQARYQVAVETAAKLLEDFRESQVPPAPQMDPKSLSWNRFLKNRVRTLRDGYESVVNEKVTLKELMKAYNRYQVSEGGAKLEVKEVEAFAEKEFGDSHGRREYSHLRVFLDEEDLEEFDRENVRRNL